jgi:endonuclease YncB( thermonuclease family)
MRLIAWFPLLGLLALGCAARADPCKAIADLTASRTPLRVPQEAVGPVVYVGDGDSLCVAATPGRERAPATWVEIRLADFHAPELSEPGGREAKAALVRIAMGRRVSCRGRHYSYDRLVAQCSRLDDGGRIGALMRKAGVEEGGHGR